MHLPTLTAPDLSVLLMEAEAAAARLRPRLALPVEHEDLRQDLLLDLLRRLPAFDPDRGGLGAFAGRVLHNQSTRIAGRIARERRATGGPLLSLDAGDDGTGLGDRLSEEDGLAIWFGAPPNSARLDRRIDIAAAVGRLPADDRRLCLALGRRSVGELAAAGFGSRAGLYRRLHALRLALTAHGLSA